VIEKGCKPVNARHVGLLMKKVTKLAGLEPTEGIHRLRHTFRSRLADAGAAPEAIHRLARHTSLAVTQRYLHASDATLEQAIGCSIGERPLQCLAAVEALWRRSRKRRFSANSGAGEGI
jgi:site-specific recombinase XerD